MNVSPLLAIVIPAYKATFLGKTLLSLSLQTDKRFRVYIGDDNSPEDLLEIISAFEDKLDLTYVKFAVNLGGHDLVAQWNRCLNLIGNEEWFMLFSDDDILDDCCIERLFKSIEENESDVFHFDLKIISAADELVEVPANYPRHLSSFHFFDLLYSGKIEARMPEFVFRTNHFLASGGFVQFPMAMRTDNATVIQCAFDKGITTVENAFVKWRLSGENVSSGQQSKEKHLVFYATIISFFNWLNDFSLRVKVPLPWNETKKLTYMFNQGYNMRFIIGYHEFLAIFKKYEKFPKKLRLLTTAMRIIFNKALTKLYK